MVDPPRLHDLSAVVHVHSTYSDGTAEVPELLDAAREAGADALLLSDHDTLAARRDGWEGHHAGVFLLVGEEVSARAGHYLAFGTEKEIPHRGRSATEIAADVRAAGGVGFAAHPFSRGGRMLLPALARRIVPAHGWPALADPQGCDGLELWSLTTDMAESWRTPAEAVHALRRQEELVSAGPPPRHLRVWDALSARRRVPAIGGLDGHQPGIRIGGRVRSPLPHRRTFRLLRTHLLCRRALGGGAGEDAATVLAALREGSAWLCSPAAAPADGARMWAETPHALVPMGAEAPAGPAVFRVRLPRPATLTVCRDGVGIARTPPVDSLDLDLEGPGAYRVEARIDGRFWLLSNPVHLR